VTELVERPVAAAPLPPGLPGVAGSADTIEEVLVCRQVVPVTHDVTTFVLEPTRPRLFSFRAGQYVRVAVEVDGRRLERCYTISSPPTRPHLLSLTVKRVPGGPVSTWLHDRLRVGDGLHVTGPFGRFTTVDHPAAGYLFLSAGSGITPLMSMTRALRDAADPADVVFVHSARTPDDIVFRRELEAMAASGPGLAVHAVCEGDGAQEAWPGLRGRLTLSALLAVAPDLHEREVFVCGPAGYRAAVAEILAAAGVLPSRTHEESFVLGGDDATATSGPGTATPAPQVAGGHAVELVRSGRTITCPPGTTVLRAAAAAGVTLPSSCEEGVCGTCVATLVTGEVDMRHGGGIRPRDEARGRFLPCCSTALTDLVVDA
jgi:ferredoxin-NADP reductase